jgi:Ca-activated chloride channel family protein
MSGDRIAAVRDALHTLVDSLRDDDTFSLVAFNSDARTVIAPTAGSQKERLRSAIDELQAGGGTDIGSGLDESFALVSESLSAANRNTVLHRVMLFTDMHPNSGMQDGRTFVRVLEEAADQGIGVSSFGVGIHFGADLANQVSQVRGGNYFHLETPEKVRRVFDRDFDLMVTPLAFDLQISLQAPPGYAIVDSYGLVGGGSERCGDQPAERCIGLTVPTVFLSRGGGGIFLRLALDGNAQEGDPIFMGHIAYQNDQGSGVEQQADLSLAPGEVPSYAETDAAIRMGAQLINVIDALKSLSGSRGVDEGRTWLAIIALRQEVVALGARADSLLNELMLLHQAIEVARLQN